MADLARLASWAGLAGPSRSMPSLSPDTSVEDSLRRLAVAASAVWFRRGRCGALCELFRLAFPRCCCCCCCCWCCWCCCCCCGENEFAVAGLAVEDALIAATAAGDTGAEPPLELRLPAARRAEALLAAEARAGDRACCCDRTFC